MAVAVAQANTKRISDLEPGYRGFLDLCRRVGFHPEPFQRRIARMVLGPEREALVLLPRGQGKSCLQSLVALHHLLTVDDAEVYCAASSRDQAKNLFQYAQRFARALGDPHIVHRHLELRWCPDADDPRNFTRFLRVLPAEAPRLYGLTPSLMLLDEYQALSDDAVYVALSSALHKRPDAKLTTISTAGQGASSPLGRLRARALGLPEVKTTRFVTEARGPDFAMLEWAVSEDEKLNAGVIKGANPGSWVTTDQIKAARQSLPELAFRRFVANQWTSRIGSWLPAGAWQACAADVHVDPGERVWLGIDVGGSRADSAVVWVTEDLRVGCRIFSGEDAVLEVAALVPELAKRFDVVEAVYDPWRAGQMAREWEQRGITAVEFPQFDSRMVPASQQLYDAIVERRLTHPDDPRLNEHVATAIARHSRRGWRVDKANKEERVDGVTAMVMAVSRATTPPPEPTTLLGFI